MGRYRKPTFQRIIKRVWTMGNIDQRTAPRDHGRDQRSGSRGGRGNERVTSWENGSDIERDWISHSKRSLSDSLGDAERSDGDVDESRPDRADDTGHASAERISERPEVEIDGKYDFTQDVSWRSHNFSIRAKSSEPRGAFLPIGTTR